MVEMISYAQTIPNINHSILPTIVYIHYLPPDAFLLTKDVPDTPSMFCITGLQGSLTSLFDL
jgi:hypothetical protein